jgi:hypothetical protein
MKDKNLHPIFDEIMDNFTRGPIDSTNQHASNPFPDLGSAFAKMKIADKLREVSTESIIGYSIHKALNDKKPLNDIMQMIMDGYKDDPSVMLDVVPQETIDLIKNFYH